MNDREIFEDLSRAVPDLQSPSGAEAVRTAIDRATEHERARIEGIVREEMGRTSAELQASLSTDEHDRFIDDLHPKSLDEMEEHPHEEDDAAYYQRVAVDLASANARPVMLELLRKRRAQVRTQTVQWLRALGRLDPFVRERAAIERTVKRIEALSAS
jgi:hypothetical protein